jgi:alanine dehydrogenase
MRIGVPAEIKNNEHRVGLTPESVYELCSAGLAVNIQSQAGSAIGFTDQDYQQSGATILSSASDVYESSDLIVKVKEPLPEEFKFLSPDKTLFTYLHLAGNKSQAVELMNTGVTGIAYETVTSSDGSLPLLAPMSKIAGQISVVVGQYFLLKPNGGIGTILGSVENIKRRVVTVIGAGVAGTEAIKKAIANDAHLKILDLSQKRLDELKEQFGTNNIEYILSDSSSISSALEASDLVIGSVYVLGKEAPKVITEEMIKKMKPGSVLVDISIDQGGCIESSKPTTHDAPVFNKHGVVHYCVTNMPGAVPLTATLALNNATLPYVKALATQGVDEALKNDSHLFNGLNIKNGEVVNPAVKEALES